MINYDVPTNSRGNNANIKAKPGVSDDTMRDNGFRQRNGQWYYFENIGHNISLNIHVLCDAVAVDVLDECFLQPYDYQSMLRKNPESKVALEVHRKVQETMERLCGSGIIKGYVLGDYI